MASASPPAQRDRERAGSSGARAAQRVPPDHPQRAQSSLAPAPSGPPRPPAAAGMTEPRAGGGGHGPRHDVPADALAVRAILRSMGAEEAEPRVLAMLLDFVYTYSADVLQDAEAAAEALGRPAGSVELGELSFAMAARGARAFVPPPPQDALQRIADEVRGGVLSLLSACCLSADC